MAAPDAPPSLTDLLDDEPPASVLALPEQSQRRLAELVAAAREHQQRDSDQAVERALRGVPLPVRGIVRKALVG